MNTTKSSTKRQQQKKYTKRKIWEPKVEDRDFV